MFQSAGASVCFWEPHVQYKQDTQAPVVDTGRLFLMWKHSAEQMDARGWGGGVVAIQKRVRPLY